jgi:hypothetical protein
MKHVQHRAAQNTHNDKRKRWGSHSAKHSDFRRICCVTQAGPPWRELDNEGAGPLAWYQLRVAIDDREIGGRADVVGVLPCPINDVMYELLCSYRLVRSETSGSESTSLVIVIRLSRFEERAVYLPLCGLHGLESAERIQNRERAFSDSDCGGIMADAQLHIHVALSILTKAFMDAVSRKGALFSTLPSLPRSGMRVRR